MDFWAEPWPYSQKRYECLPEMYEFRQNLGFYITHLYRGFSGSWFTTVSSLRRWGKEANQRTKATPRRVTSSKNLTAWGPELREAQWEGIPSPHAQTPEPSSSWIQTGNYFKMVVKEEGGLHEICKKKLKSHMYIYSQGAPLVWRVLNGHSWLKVPEVARNLVPEGTRDSMSSRGRINPD
jgi:hypothetical protein